MINNEAMTKMTLKYYSPNTAYAYEGAGELTCHNESWIMAKKLTITFDKQEAVQYDNYRLASSKELLWWLGASDCEMPKIIECADGLFQWIEPGYDIVESVLFKI
ncbi:hypothetical protein [Paenibacillus typhae]|uniref:Uncharacterized protein n=1 Tax=Paenibacillus typhae TaxID=1174501 RepID=A0A1G8MN52_9BACL|nr:hypothetical protein [Paenibacillus typhae]SDI69286.1 hypothetical protein SAMN05216192_107160 [Paenibacillus typhae]